MMTRIPQPGQDMLWQDTDTPDLLAAPDAHGVQDPDGMEQPSMFEAVELTVADLPFEACDECGQNIWDRHCDLCGECQCDGTACETHDPEE